MGEAVSLYLFLLTTQAFTAWQAVASYFGINVGGYESGPSLVAGIEGEVSRSPRMADFIKRYYMENYFPTGAQTANYFALGISLTRPSLSPFPPLHPLPLSLSSFSN